MIHYALICDKRHEFEIWFKNSADYDRQRKRGYTRRSQADALITITDGLGKTTSVSYAAIGFREIPPD